MLTRPSLAAVVFVAASFALVFGGGSLARESILPESIAPLIRLAFVLLWLAAIGIQIPTAPGALRPTMALGFGVYLVSFILPSAHRGTTDYLGYECFIQAFVWVFEAWLANPAFLIAAALMRRGKVAVSVSVGLVAILFGALGPMHEGVTVDVGFFVWMLGMAIAIFGTAVASVFRAAQQQSIVHIG